MRQPYLVAVIPALDAQRWILNAIDSVRAHVDTVVVFIDSRTQDNTAGVVTSHEAGSRIKNLVLRQFDWRNESQEADGPDKGYAVGGAGMYNTGRLVQYARWTLFLDADETIDPEHACRLRSICQEADKKNIDCIGFARNNWWDLARTNLRAEWSPPINPDYQLRLQRDYIRFRWRVHQTVENIKNLWKVSPDLLTLQHFNLAYRNEADWSKVNAFYEELMRLDVADGRPK